MSGSLALKLGLPPSLGREPSWEMARELALLLHASGFSLVVPFKTYEELERAVLSGAVDVAWGPPIVCAHVEAGGGTVLLRGVRGDERTYRSAIVARAQDVFTLDALDKGTFRPRAAWVDPASVGGYLLARAHLQRLGISVDRAFLQQSMLGSYAACLDALLAFETDLSALFVGKHGLEPLWGAKSKRLKVLALTEEVPNDGVVLSPALSPERTAQLREKLTQVFAAPALRKQVTSMLHADDFDEPPPGTYAPVLKLFEP
ncbi:MAG TPA: PhnD/SsuA/transferrin family substrate-binding protein [Kofleriaceae bacterium]|nr:PhnD/SsuA/transferrin family substrate-binding protein [Kofleriaceae bacterium]